MSSSSSLFGVETKESTFESKSEAFQDNDPRSLLTKIKSPSDHLARKVGKDIITYNIMTQYGINDSFTGGFVEKQVSDEGIAIITSESEADYSQRILTKIVPAIKNMTRENSDVDFFHLQEAPLVNDEKDNLGKEFISTLLKQLNSDNDNEWGVVTEQQSKYSKCIVYRKSKYAIDEKMTASLQQSAHPQQYSEEGPIVTHVFSAIFKNKDTNNFRAHFNVHLMPGGGAEQSHDNTIKDYVSKAEKLNDRSIDEVYVSGDFNYRMGMNSSMLTPIWSNVHTYDNYGAKGKQSFDSVDGGFAKGKFTLLSRQDDALIDPQTGKVFDSLEMKSAQEDDSYDVQLFGDTCLLEYKTTLNELKANLIPLAMGGSDDSDVNVMVEVNQYNARRVLIKSKFPIPFLSNMKLKEECCPKEIRYYISLQHSASTQEAINSINNLNKTHGYVSESLPHLTEAIEACRKLEATLEEKKAELQKGKDTAQRNVETVGSIIASALNDKHKAHFISKINHYQKLFFPDEKQENLQLDKMSGDQLSKKLNEFSTLLDTISQAIFQETSALPEIKDLDDKILKNNTPELKGEREKLKTERDSLFIKKKSEHPLFTKHTALKSEKAGFTSLSSSISQKVGQCSQYMDAVVGKTVVQKDFENIDLDISQIKSRKTRLESLGQQLLTQNTESNKYQVFVNEQKGLQGKIKKLIAECESYNKRLHGKFYFSENVTVQKKESILRMLNALEYPGSRNEKLAKFAEEFNSSRDILTKNRDGWGLKFVKAVLSILTIWAAPITWPRLWKVDGEGLVKRLDGFMQPDAESKLEALAESKQSSTPSNS